MRDVRKETLDEDLRVLDNRISLSKWLIVGSGLILPSIYFVWFSYHSIPISIDSGDWGTLGDFIGGILNPLIAFSAFYWLTRSVRIQKEELGQTRATLDETLDAQSAQIKISALTALISSATSEIDVLHTRLTYLCAQFKTDDVTGILNLEGEWISIEAARTRIAAINSEISIQLQRRYTYEVYILNLLQSAEIDNNTPP
ncbi:MAG: hypothetical protein AB1807_11350 [Pseudomonadota bacterium]